MAEVPSWGPLIIKEGCVPVTYFCGKFHQGHWENWTPGCEVATLPGCWKDSGCVGQGHLYNCSCHLEGTSSEDRQLSCREWAVGQGHSLSPSALRGLGGICLHSCWLKSTATDEVKGCRVARKPKRGPDSGMLRPVPGTRVVRSSSKKR